MALGIHIDLLQFALSSDTLSQTPFYPIRPGIPLMIGGNIEALVFGVSAKWEQKQQNYNYYLTFQSKFDVCWRHVSYPSAKSKRRQENISAKICKLYNSVFNNFVMDLGSCLA
jgi:hypothetical protein